ncbi:MAG: hypothetical protein AAGL66_06210 [Pseudomonadota bacterium]
MISLPATVESFLASGGAAATVLVLVLAEALLLFLRWRRGMAPPLPYWAPQLLAGAFLVCALLLVQLAMSPLFVGLALMAAGMAHLLGFRLRWFR